MLPHTGEIADDIAIVKSMHTDAFNHAPAQIFMNTGSQQFGRPSFGAWTLYGGQIHIKTALASGVTAADGPATRKSVRASSALRPLRSVRAPPISCHPPGEDRRCDAERLAELLDHVAAYEKEVQTRVEGKQEPIRVSLQERPLDERAGEGGPCRREGDLYLTTTRLANAWISSR